MTTTLIGSSCFTAVDEVGHEHAEAAVADERDDLAVRIRDLRADGVGQPAGHRGEVARQRERLALPGRGCGGRTRS